jgi:anti-sigma factor RsiW
MPDFWNRLFGRRGRNGHPGGLACQELVELVTDYFEGALSSEDRVRFEAHIAGCEDCTTYVQQMREMLTVLGQLTTESLSPEAERELLAAFRDWKAGAS